MHTNDVVSLSFILILAISCACALVAAIIGRLLSDRGVAAVTAAMHATPTAWGQRRARPSQRTVASDRAPMLPRTALALATLTVVGMLAPSATGAADLPDLASRAHWHDDQSGKDGAAILPCEHRNVLISEPENDDRATYLLCDNDVLWALRACRTYPADVVL